MNEQTFVERRCAEWTRLNQLCDKAGTGPHALAPEELREFVQIYRRVCSDLASARTKSANVSLIEYLNSTAGRAYAVLYRSPRKSFWRWLCEFVVDAPRTVRRQIVFVTLSAVLFFGSGVLSATLIHTVPEARDVFVSAQMESNFKAWRDGLPSDRSSSEGVAMTGFYASNNPKTAIVAATIGAGTFGFGSILMLFQNGAIIGALANDMLGVGKLGFLLASLAPHGVPELSGIIVAGAAGLLFGWALIAPGRKSRGDSLRAVSKDGMTLIGTSVILMFLAAPIEGFFSFNSVIPIWLKVGVALIEVGAWTAFWVGFGRPKESAAS